MLIPRRLIILEIAMSKVGCQPGKVNFRDQSRVGVGKQQGRLRKDVETNESPVVLQLVQQLTSSVQDE